jgi:hypothetical protein
MEKEITKAKNGKYVYAHNRQNDRPRHAFKPKNMGRVSKRITFGPEQTD